MNWCSSLDDFGTLFVEKLVAAVRTEELDLLVPKFLPMAVEITFALRTGHPKNLRHDSLPRNFHHRDAEPTENLISKLFDSATSTVNSPTLSFFR
jgi:hypothetical protein